MQKIKSFNTKSIFYIIIALKNILLFSFRNHKKFLFDEKNQYSIDIRLVLNDFYAKD